MTFHKSDLAFGPRIMIAALCVCGIMTGAKAGINDSAAAMSNVCKCTWDIDKSNEIPIIE